MLKLNLPDFKPNIKTTEKGDYIFCPFRRKFVKLTPEEWVRQGFADYMLGCLGFPKGRMAVEHSITVGKMKKRADIVVFSKNGNPCVIVECKAASVAIGQDTADQAAVYSYGLGAEYLFLTNGIRHLAMKTDGKNKKYVFARELPRWEDIEV